MQAEQNPSIALFGIKFDWELLLYTLSSDVIFSGTRNVGIFLSSTHRFADSNRYGTHDNWYLLSAYYQPGNI